MCFTQNIDTLERRAGVPESKLVEAHGSFATHACISCRRKFPDDEMKTAVATQEIPRCKHCKGLVKPNITFFGEGVSFVHCQCVSNFDHLSRSCRMSFI